MTPRRLLPFILLTTVLAGAIGLDWGLPYNWHADEKVNTATAMIDRHSADPDYFVNPSLHVYLVWGLTHIAYVAHPGTFVPTALGWHMESVRRNGPNRPVTFLAYRLARWLSVFCAALTAWLLWKSGASAFDRPTGLLAAAFLSVTMGLANLAHFATPETTLFAIVVAALWSFERLALAPTPARYVIAGALIGLACSTKYTVWLLGAPFLAAHLTARRTRRDNGSAYGLGLLVAAGLAAAVGFIVATPYSVFSARRFMEDLAFNWVTGAPEGTLAGQHRTWGTYVITLGNALGWPLFVASCAGAAWSAWRAWRGGPRAAVVVHGTWILAFWGFYGVSPHHALRFIMPIVPSLLLLGAAGVVDAARGLEPARRRALAVAVALVVLYSAAYTAVLDWKFLRDPRYAAGEWLNEYVRPGSTVAYFASEAYLPYFVRPAFALQYVNVMSQYPVKGEEFEARIGEVLRSGPDVIVDANFYFDRFLDAPARFPERAELYRGLLTGRNAWTLRPVARFSVHGPRWLDPSPELVAPDVIVFARGNTRWR